MAKAPFISFEGGEGCGKSTQAQLLYKSLMLAKLEAVMTREPGGTPEAEAIRSLLVDGEPDRWDAMSETFLFCAARSSHVKRIIKPALKNNQWVLCDRFSDSTIVYQGHAGGLAVKKMEEMSELASDGVEPDLTILFDMDPNVGLERAKGRGREMRFEQKGEAFHQKVREGFLKQAKKHTKRMVVINAQADIPFIHKQIIGIVNTRFNVECECVA